MTCKSWNKTVIQSLAAALILFGGSTTASAVPVVSIDLDPGTAGIQSSLSVVSGASFTIDMVLTGDGVFAFDSFAFAADFNNLGAVLGLSGGTGSPAAGGITGLAPILAADLFSGAPVGPGTPLTPSGVPFPLTPGFTASSDGVGIVSLGLPFGPLPIPAGVTIDLFSLTLVAMAPGASDVIPNAGGLPGGLLLGGLALGGAPVPFATTGGTVTVMPSVGAIPLPAAVWLFATALVGLLGFSRRRKAI